LTVCKKFSGRKFLESPWLEKRGNSEENRGAKLGQKHRQEAFRLAACWAILLLWRTMNKPQNFGALGISYSCPAQHPYPYTHRRPFSDDPQPAQRAVLVIVFLIEDCQRSERCL